MIKINELDNYFNKDIQLSGFVDSIRILQYVVFIILKDETGKVQITIEKEDNSKLLDTINLLKIDSVIQVKGKVLENEKVKLNKREIIPSDLKILSLPLEELPFDYKNPEGVNIDTRLDYRFLDLREESHNLIFKIESDLVKYLREYCYLNNLREIHTPKLIGSASESGSEVFEVKYFNRLAYLAQSPQFYKQMAIASNFGSVFEVAPAFRAENSNTNRHATEFTSFDIELAYINSYEDVMDFESNLLIYTLKKIKEKYADDIMNYYHTEVKIPKKIPHLTLTELNKIFKEKYHYEVSKEEEYDLSSEGEKLAYKYAMDEYDSEFIFVTGYPAEKRAFYHMRDDKGILLGFDLIWKGVEITSGAQREHRYEILKKQCEEKGLGKNIAYYLEFFKYGCPPHGGFGLGVDRLIMLLLNVSSLKESMFIFRGPNRLEP